MDKKQYTPTKSSKILSTVTNTQATSNNKTVIDYTQRSNLGQDPNIVKEYDILKQQVKQLQFQNRQLSTQAQRLRYQKNIHQNKYMQKLSYEEETVSQFQKEKNYQLQLIKIKCQEDTNRIRRQYQIKIDQLQRELKTKDYSNRESNEKSAYLQLKVNQLRKGVETLEGELMKYRQNNSNITNLINQQEFAKKKLQMITTELDMQKSQMETQIHILLDIEAEKSRKMNYLQVQLKNSESKERSLHQKLNSLTQHFANLEEHITSVKERLSSADTRNQESEKHLQYAVQILGAKQEAVVTFNDQQIQLRQELQRQQKRELRRQKQLQELMIENQRVHQQLNVNKHKFHEIYHLREIDF